MAKLSKDKVTLIKDLLTNGFQSQVDIAKQVGVTPRTISNINIGQTYSIDGFDYPIRKEIRNERQLILPLITAKRARIINIQNELMYNDITMRELSKKYAISYSSISRINSGERSHDDSLVYPLRFTTEMLGRRVRTAAAEGMTVVEIQNKFGVTYLQIKSYMRGVN